MNRYRKISRRKKVEIGRLKKKLSLYKNVPVLDFGENGFLIEDDYLNSRQKEVVELLIEGYSNKEISVKLFIAPTTVKYHVKNIYKIYNVHSRGHLIEKFIDKKIEVNSN